MNNNRFLSRFLGIARAGISTNTATSPARPSAPPRRRVTPVISAPMPYRSVLPSTRREASGYVPLSNLTSKQEDNRGQQQQQSLTDRVVASGITSRGLPVDSTPKNPSQTTAPVVASRDREFITPPPSRRALLEGFTPDNPSQTTAPVVASREHEFITPPPKRGHSSSQAVELTDDEKKARKARLMGDIPKKERTPEGSKPMSPKTTELCKKHLAELEDIFTRQSEATGKASSKLGQKLIKHSSKLLQEITDSLGYDVEKEGTHHSGGGASRTGYLVTTSFSTTLSVCSRVGARRAGFGIELGDGGEFYCGYYSPKTGELEGVGCSDGVRGSFNNGIFTADPPRRKEYFIMDADEDSVDSDSSGSIITGSGVKRALLLPSSPDVTNGSINSRFIQHMMNRNLELFRAEPRVVTHSKFTKDSFVNLPPSLIPNDPYSHALVTANFLILSEPNTSRRGSKNSIGESEA